jgi:hypothetical protein
MFIAFRCTNEALVIFSAMADEKPNTQQSRYPTIIRHREAVWTKIAARDDQRTHAETLPQRTRQETTRLHQIRVRCRSTVPPMRSQSHRKAPEHSPRICNLLPTLWGQLYNRSLMSVVRVLRPLPANPGRPISLFVMDFSNYDAGLVFILYICRLILNAA